MSCSDFDVVADDFVLPEEVAEDLETEYDYRVCDFCLTVPFKDCLPWDFSLFKAAEIPLFFPEVIENKDGSLDVKQAQELPLSVISH